MYHYNFFSRKYDDLSLISDIFLSVILMSTTMEKEYFTTNIFITIFKWTYLSCQLLRNQITANSLNEIIEKN